MNTRLRAPFSIIVLTVQVVSCHGFWFQGEMRIQFEHFLKTLKNNIKQVPHKSQSLNCTQGTGVDKGNDLKAVGNVNYITWYFLKSGINKVHISLIRQCCQIITYRFHLPN